MMRIWFIAGIFSTILQRIFCECTLDKRKNSKCLNYAVWGGYFVVFHFAAYISADLSDLTLLNLVIYVSTFFITVRILYVNPVRTLAAVTIFMYLSGKCAELLVYYGKEWLPCTFDKASDLLCIVLSKVVWFLIIELTSLLIKMKKKMELNIRDWFEVSIVPIGSIWILLSIFVIGTPEDNLFSFTAVFMVLMINVFTYYLYDKAKENMERSIREEILEKQCEYYARQSRESKDWWEELRQFRHNMTQRYILEKAFLENKDYDALEKYCDESLNFFKQRKKLAETGNIYVDSIVNYKADMAEKEGIEFIAKVRVPQNAELNAEDISICLGNLLDNAIEAVKELPDDKMIKLQVRAEGNNLVIEIKNRYQNKICKEGEQYLTGKKDNKNHGLGLLIVRRIVEKYQGEMIIQDENEEFDVLILMYDFFK